MRTAYRWALLSSMHWHRDYVGCTPLEYGSFRLIIHAADVDTRLELTADRKKDGRYISHTQQADAWFTFKAGNYTAILIDLTILQKYAHRVSPAPQSSMSWIVTFDYAKGKTFENVLKALRESVQ